MKAIVTLDFFADYHLLNKIKEMIHSYGILFNAPEKGIKTEEVYFQIPIILTPSINIEEICNRLSNEHNILHIGDSIDFIFSDDEFEKSPLFQLNSTGNSAKAFLEDKGTEVQWIEICKACELKAKKQISPLVIDTSQTGGRLMLNVDTNFWVVSEKMAELMEIWNLTGYQLKEVIHKGTKVNKQPYYQVLPLNTLPAWSSLMKHYHFVTEKDNQCPVCNIRGRIDYPYHYNQSELEGNISDINIMKEWKPNGSWAYHPFFISKKFRDLLIENKITRGVRDKFSKFYGYKDWLLNPIILIN